MPNDDILDWIAWNLERVNRLVARGEYDNHRARAAIKTILNIARSF